MSHRLDYFFRQKVTESELNLGFALLEQADHDLAADLNIYGIISGAVPAPHSPVPALSIDLTAPARAYDNLGQRIFFGTGQTVDCGVDLVGIPTDVATAGNERWLGVFLRFKRLLSDPRTDGNSQQVFFRRDESFEFVVRQAPEGILDVAPKPALQADELLVCDVRRRPGQAQIVATDIDISRRQAFIFAQGSSVSVVTGAWSILQPLAATVQSALDETDAELRDHFTGVARRHAAAAIDFTPHGFVGAGNVQSALDELVDDLGTGAVGSSGATRIGVDAAAGAPNALPAGSVKSQLAQLLSFLNTHVGVPTGAHNASAIAAIPHNNVATTNVQAQLQEIVTDLLATEAAAPGAGLVGVDAIAGSPNALLAGTVKTQLVALLDLLNAHANAISGRTLIRMANGTTATAPRTRLLLVRRENGLAAGDGYGGPLATPMTLELPEPGDESYTTTIAAHSATQIAVTYRGVAVGTIAGAVATVGQPATVNTMTVIADKSGAYIVGLGTAKSAFAMTSFTPIAATAHAVTEFTVRGHGLLGLWRLDDTFLGRFEIDVVDDDSARIRVDLTDLPYVAGDTFQFALIRSNGDSIQSPNITVI